MNTRGDYKKAFAIVGNAVRAWDPYSLFAEGAPHDEFDDEIARIVSRIRQFHDAGAVAFALATVFSDAFGSSRFAPADCQTPADRIFNELRNAGLLPVDSGL